MGIIIERPKDVRNVCPLDVIKAVRELYKYGWWAWNNGLLVDSNLSFLKIVAKSCGEIRELSTVPCAAFNNDRANDFVEWARVIKSSEYWPRRNASSVNRLVADNADADAVLLARCK